jgi:hypothetical protein
MMLSVSGFVDEISAAKNVGKLDMAIRGLLD